MNAMNKGLKTLRKQSVYLLTIAFLIIGVFISYALVSYDIILTGNHENEISMCSVDINFIDKNPVTLLSSIPIDDSEAESLEAYKLTIKNNSSKCKSVNYIMSMIDYCIECEKENGICKIGDNTCNCNDGYKIASSVIKYQVINAKTNKVVSEGLDPFTNFKVTGKLTAANQEDTYDVRMWISSTAKNDDLYVSNNNGGYLTNTDGTFVTKDFSSKIKLDVDATDIVNNLSSTWKDYTDDEANFLALYTLSTKTLPNTYEYNGTTYTKDTTVDVSYAQNGSVLLGTYINGSDKIAVMGQDDGVVAPANSSNLFSYMVKMVSMDLSNFDTSKVTTMSSMFARNSSLTSLDVSNFDTSSVHICLGLAVL